MQLAYELLPVRVGQDENLPTATSKLGHRSRVCLLDECLQEIKAQSRASAAANQQADDGRTRMFDHTHRTHQLAGQECPTDTV